MAWGTGRNRRLFFLEMILEDDPDLYGELIALRGTNPQAYRRRIAKLSQYEKGHKAHILGRGSIPVPWDDVPDSITELGPHETKVTAEAE